MSVGPGGRIIRPGEFALMYVPMLRSHHPVTSHPIPQDYVLGHNESICDYCCFIHGDDGCQAVACHGVVMMTETQLLEHRLFGTIPF